MERKVLTWEDLANKISQMTPEEKKETVKVWADECNLCNDVCLVKEDEDLCYHEDYPSEGCSLRSDFEEDDDISVALKSGTYYLYA